MASIIAQSNDKQPTAFSFLCVFMRGLRICLYEHYHKKTWLVKRYQNVADLLISLNRLLNIQNMMSTFDLRCSMADSSTKFVIVAILCQYLVSSLKLQYEMEEVLVDDWDIDFNGECWAGCLY